MENLYDLPCSKNTKSFFSERLPPDRFDPSCHEMLWTSHPSPSLEVHKTLLRPVPTRMQVQQEHWGSNDHSSTPRTAHLEKPDSFVRILLTFLLPSIQYNHISWHTSHWISTYIQNWFSGLLIFLLTALKLSSSRSISTGSPRHCPISHSFHTVHKWNICFAEVERFRT